MIALILSLRFYSLTSFYLLDTKLIIKLDLYSFNFFFKGITENILFHFYLGLTEQSSVRYKVFFTIPLTELVIQDDD